MISKNLRFRGGGCIGLVLMVAASALATELLYDESNANLGIPVYPAGNSTWRTKLMTYPGKVVETNWIWLGHDFFEAEYGASLVFNRDWIKEYGYATNSVYREDSGHSTNGVYAIEGGRLIFATGARGFSFGFGGTPYDTNSLPSIHFGARDWGPFREYQVYLRMALDQDVNETRWRFTVATHRNWATRQAVSFTITGKGRQEVYVPLFYWMKNLPPDGHGIRFDCLTTNAVVKVESMKIGPVTKTVYFRRTINLARKPILAHATFNALSGEGDLYVNGVAVASARKGCFLQTVNLAPYLSVGTNTIACSKPFISWWGGEPNLFFEGVAVDRDGQITRILGDSAWKCSVAVDPDWMKPDFDDHTWIAPRLDDDLLYVTYSYLANPQKGKSDSQGQRVGTGINPHHMGMLDVQPAGRRYPIFNYTEEPSFNVRLPAGATNVHVQLEVYRAGTDLRVETATGGVAVVEGDFAANLFKLKTQEVGPYRLNWKLLDAKGRVLETRREELIVVGPIAQETLPLASFEESFEKRLRLVQHIDCFRAVEDDTEFLDHTGMRAVPAINKGRIATQDGMTYRETGAGCYDYFAYRLHLKERGVPYLVEVVVPDNALRYIYSGVVEQYPVMYIGQPSPPGTFGYFTATGTGFTGGRFPITNGKRRLRYIYYPTSFAAAVVVMSGLSQAPAAACEINLYRIEGGLPALEVPKTDRLFGSHNERLSVMSLTMGCENAMERTARLVRVGHTDGWYHWYKQIERKIQWLRFQGQNMAAEGIYMYDQGEYPSRGHSQSPLDEDGQDLDPFQLLVKLYEYNGIHCLLSVEYCRSPMIDMAKLDTVSDRKMMQGAMPLHLVDRHGKQLMGGMGTGLNFLHPKYEEVFMDFIGEIHDRYADAGRVEGLFLVIGAWWTPGFVNSAFWDLKDIEVGYDDLTVGLFEQETRIKLGIPPRDPQRFQRRYDILTGQYRDRWLDWRARKLQEFFQRVTQRIQQRGAKWKLFVYPITVSSTMGADANPFKLEAKASQAERDGHVPKCYREFSLPIELYERDPNVCIVQPLWYIPTLAMFTPSQVEAKFLESRSHIMNRGTRSVIDRVGAFYHGVALNEVDCPTSGARRWWWLGGIRGAFVLRGMEDNCMDDFVDLLTGKTPKTIFYAWMDCQMDTAFGPQSRRFCKSFYATPDVEFTPLPAERARGVIAQIAAKPGGAWLKLVNNSPYLSSGVIGLRGKSVYDRVYDRFLSGSRGFFRANETYRLEMAPNDIRILDVQGDSTSVACEFALSAEAADALESKARGLLQDKRFLDAASPEAIAKIRGALTGRKDPFRLYNLMDDVEVERIIQERRGCIR